jgi:endonuclease III-like uncharacterized protein
MEKLLEGNLPRIADSLERIAKVLEKSPVDTVKSVQDIVKEEIQEISNTITPEEQFIQKVEKLNDAFKDLVDSFANGEAQRVDYMSKYPFESFSIVQLSISVNAWLDSIKSQEGKKKEG